MIGKLPAPISDEHAELLRRYRLHQDRRGLLPSTIDCTGTRTRAFARWMEPRSITEATKADVDAFLDRRKTRDGRKLNSRTRYYWIAYLHGFYRWAVDEGLTADDPTRTMVRPKQRRVLPRLIDSEDPELAIRTAPSQMRALLSLAAFAGLRVQEIAGLERDNIIEAKGLIRVRHGKGAKERIVPLHPDVLAALRCLHAADGRHLREAPWWTLTPNRLSTVIAAYLRDLGIDATAHMARHWFATEVYAAGHDIRVTQELLGHSEPSTTAGYIAYSHIDAAAAVASLSFRATAGVGGAVTPT